MLRLFSDDAASAFWDAAHPLASPPRKDPCPELPALAAELRSNLVGPPYSGIDEQLAQDFVRHAIMKTEPRLDVFRRPQHPRGSSPAPLPRRQQPAADLTAAVCRNLPRGRRLPDFAGFR